MKSSNSDSGFVDVAVTDSPMQIITTLTGQKGSYSMVAVLPNRQVDAEPIRIAACAGTARMVEIWNIETRQLETVLCGHEGMILSMTALPLHQRHAGFGDVSLNTYPAQHSSSSESSPGMSSSVLTTIESGDDLTLLATGCEVGVVKIWYIPKQVLSLSTCSTAAVSHLVADKHCVVNLNADCRDPIYSIASSESCDRLFVGNMNGTLTIWDITNLNECSIVQSIWGPHCGIKSLIYLSASRYSSKETRNSAMDNTLKCSNSNSSSNSSSGGNGSSNEGSEQMHRVGILICGDMVGSMVVWDHFKLVQSTLESSSVHPLKEMTSLACQFDGHNSWINCLSFVPFTYSDAFVTSTKRGGARRRAGRTSRCRNSRKLQQRRQHSRRVVVASGSMDSSVKFWEVVFENSMTKLICIASFDHVHNDGVRCFAFVPESADNSCWSVVTGCRDNTLSVWQLFIPPGAYVDRDTSDSSKSNDPKMSHRITSHGSFANDASLTLQYSLIAHSHGVSSVAVLASNSISRIVTVGGDNLIQISVLSHVVLL